MDIVEKARGFAGVKHAGQRRKYSEQPYFNHLHAVASLLEGAGVVEPSVIAAAYLHDTVEDTEATMEEVIQEFGHDIGELVYWLTDAGEGSHAGLALMSRWRLARAPMPAKLIKFADIIDNSTSIRANRQFFAKWAEEKRQILTRMLEVEGSGLASHHLFKQAWSAVTL